MKSQSNYMTSRSQLSGVADDIFGARLEAFIVGLPETKAYALWKDITKELLALKKVFDGTDETSEVSILNASKVDIDTSDEMKTALNTCESYYIKTQKLFDVNSGDEVNFDAYVKAYAVQKIAALIKKAKVKDAFVNFGDSIIYAVGHKPFYENWPYAIVNPQTDDEIQAFELVNEYLAISQFDNKLYCIRGKEPVEAKVLSLVLPKATSNQLHDMFYSFKSLEHTVVEL